MWQFNFPRTHISVIKLSNTLHMSPSLWFNLFILCKLECILGVCFLPCRELQADPHWCTPSMYILSIAGSMTICPFVSALILIFMQCSNGQQKSENCIVWPVVLSLASCSDDVWRRFRLSYKLLLDCRSFLSFCFFSVFLTWRLNIYYVL